MQNGQDARNNLFVKDPALRERVAYGINKILNDTVKRLNEQAAKDNSGRHYKEIDNSGVYDLMRNESAVSNFIRANDKDELFQEAKANNQEQKQSGLARSFGFILAGKHPNEQKRFLEKYNNIKGAKQHLQETLVDFLENTDLTNMPKDFNQYGQDFIKNADKSGPLWTIESSIRDQGLEFNDTMRKVYGNVSGLMQEIGKAQEVFDYQKNPFSLVIPLNQPGMSDILSNSIQDIAKYFKEDPELSQAFSQEQIFQYIGTLASTANYKDEYPKIVEGREKLVKLGMNTKDFFTKNTFQLNGKDVSYSEAQKAILNNENVTVREYSETEKAKIQEGLYTSAFHYKDKEKQVAAGEATMDKDKTAKNISQYLDKLDDFTKRINKTNSVFSKDTDQYKHMKDSLNDLSKEYKEMKDQLKSELKGLDEKTIKEKTNEKIIEFYDKNKDRLKKVKDDTKAYAKMKTEKNKQEVEAGKKLSSRSKDRLEIANELKGFMATEFKPLDVTPVPDQPFKYPFDGKKIEATIASKEKNNEIQITKDLSKDKELEKDVELENINSK